MILWAASFITSRMIGATWMSSTGRENESAFSPAGAFCRPTARAMARGSGLSRKPTKEHQTILLPEEYYGISTEKQLFCGYLSAHCQVFPRSCETIGLPVALSLPVSVGSELPVCLQVNESSLRVQRH